MATLLLERSVFLDKEVMRLNATQIAPLADPLSGRYPTCTLCGKTTLRSSSDIPKAEDGLLKLPSNYLAPMSLERSVWTIISRACILKISYTTIGVQCNVLLFTQSTVAERYGKALETNQQIVSFFWLLAISMFTLCVVALSSSAFAWQWILLFCPLGFMCAAGIDVCQRHSEIGKQLVDLEKGRHSEVNTTESVASAQTRMCDAEASTVAEASLAKDCATDQPKISCSDDDMTIVEHNEDEERAGLLSNTV
jgi:hypothetical protein